MVRWMIFAALLAMQIGVTPVQGEEQPKLPECAGEAFRPGPDGRIFCEQHFYFTGSCSGSDQLPSVNSPWEERQISIRGVTVAFMAQGITSGYVYAGNSYNHDVMTWLDPTREGVVRSWFPDGLSFQFPGIDDEKQGSRSRADLHVLCKPMGAPYSGWLIIYYTIP